MDFPIHITDLPKNGTSKIRLQIVEFSGFLMLDIRTFAKGKNQTEFVATSKGVTIHIKDYCAMLDALKKFEPNILEILK